jgi:hypothetical protein
MSSAPAGQGAARELFYRLYFQFTEGCGSMGCCNQICASNPGVVKKGPTAAAAASLETIERQLAAPFRVCITDERVNQLQHKQLSGPGDSATADDRQKGNPNKVEIGGTQVHLRKIMKGGPAASEKLGSPAANMSEMEIATPHLKKPRDIASAYDTISPSVVVNRDSPRARPKRVRNLQQHPVHLGQKIFYNLDGKWYAGTVMKAALKGDGTWPTVDFGKGYVRVVRTTRMNMGDCWFPKQEAAQEKDVQTPKNKKQRANSNEKKAVETEDHKDHWAQRNWAQCAKCHLWRFRWDTSWRKPATKAGTLRFLCPNWLFSCQKMVAHAIDKDVDVIECILCSKPATAASSASKQGAGVTANTNKHYLVMWTNTGGVSWESFDTVEGSHALSEFEGKPASCMPSRIVDARPNYDYNSGAISGVEFLTEWTSSKGALCTQSWESDNAVGGSLAWVAYLHASQLHVRMDDKPWQNSQNIQSQLLRGVQLAQEITAHIADILPKSMPEAYEQQRRLFFIRLPLTGLPPRIDNSCSNGSHGRAAAQPESNLVGLLAEHRLFVTFGSGSKFQAATIKKVAVDGAACQQFFVQYDDGDASWCR